MLPGTGELHGLSGHDNGQRWEGSEEAATTFFDGEASGGELFCVFAGEFVVGDESDAAGLEDADDLLQGLAAGWCVVDVVNAEIRDDDVEGGVGEGHCLGRLAAESAEIGDTLEFEIVLRGGGGVSAHVHVGPDVDAGRVAGAGESGDTFCCACEQKTTSATYVEDVLVTLPGVQA